MHRVATMSPYRVWARKCIDETIASHVHGPVQCLKKDDLRDLKKALHASVGFPNLSAWEKRILREEWRVTLGYPPKRRPKMKRIRERFDVMPSMRDWAIRHGVLPKPEPSTQP